MGKVLKRLQLQFFLILWISYSGVKAAPYSKYGRTCRDIGCLPREVCTMAYDTCSFNQNEGTNCGRYPTCVKADKTQQPAPQQNTGPSNPSPLPSTPNTNIWNLPAATTTTTTTTRRPTTTTTTTRRAWTTKSPFINPANPSYGGGGNYFGNRYGDDSIFGGGGGGSSSRTSTTKRPSSGSSIDSFFSGFSSFLSGDTGKLLQGLLSNGGGSGSGSSSSNRGGFGSLFGGDTRPLTENKNYRGGLFSENTNQGSSMSNNNNDYNRYPVTRQGQVAPSPSAPSASSPSSNSNPSHGNYGWKLS